MPSNSTLQDICSNYLQLLSEATKASDGSFAENGRASFGVKCQPLLFIWKLLLLTGFTIIEDSKFYSASIPLASQVWIV
jgi:hypothetical protein